MIGLVLGPVLMVVILLLNLPDSLPSSAQAVAAIGVLMATWWITEAIPIPITALLPIALFPMFGVMKSSEVTVSYANHLIFLYMGGFMIAVTIERWNLHKRIALLTIRFVGTSPSRIVLGFMVATAFLSMWISNTATTMMMLPIGLAVIKQAAEMLGKHPGQVIDTSPGNFRFGTALMLGIAYSASIGGIATLIGTPPNAILAGIVEETLNTSISFADWMLIGFPISVVMLLVSWFYLTRIASPSEVKEIPGGKRLIQSELSNLGPLSAEEKRTGVVFLLVASAWILRGFIEIESLQLIQDSTIAILGAVALFLIPAGNQQGPLLNWTTAVKIPWDIILLFGGGFALANGFSESGLTEWLASSMSLFQNTHYLLVIGVVSLMVIFLTEVTSNTATASLTLPIMAAMASSIGIHPFGLMVPVAIAASFAFMMPVATPPNAIVFSSRYVSIPQMARIGLWLNLIGCLILIIAIWILLPLGWNLSLTQ